MFNIILPPSKYRRKNLSIDSFQRHSTKRCQQARKGFCRTFKPGCDLWPRSSLACCVARLTRPGLTVWAYGEQLLFHQRPGRATYDRAEWAHGTGLSVSRQYSSSSYARNRALRRNDPVVRKQRELQQKTLPRCITRANSNLEALGSSRSTLDWKLPGMGCIELHSTPQSLFLSKAASRARDKPPGTQ